MPAMFELKELLEKLISEESLEAVKLFKTKCEAAFLTKLQKIRELGEILKMIRQIE